MRAVVILADSVNRRFLDIYGSKEPAKTPNLDRLATESMVFDDHWVGSAPCMPARRDLMTGRLNFLEKPWGGMEPFDYALPYVLKTANVHSHIVTDHYHYMLKGGENYTSQFTSFELIRGQEHDTINTFAGKEGIIKKSAPEGYKGSYDWGHDITYSQFKTPDEYPTPTVLSHAASWLEKNKDADNFLLWAECFDPHEPFDAPQEFVDLYKDEEDTYEGQPLYWPNYKKSIFDEVETKHLRKLYKASLSFMDHYIGKIFDVMDKYDMWKDTAVIFTSDHGFMLGEHGFMAKNYMPAFAEVFNIPLLVHKPGCTPGHFGGITQNIDLYPTICNLFGVDTSQINYPLHGIDLNDALNAKTKKAHEEIIFGYYGASVNYYNGKYVYMRAAKDPSNKPLNIYTAMPTTSQRWYGHEVIKPSDYSKIEHCPNYAGYPVFKYPAEIVNIDRGSSKFDKRNEYNGENALYDMKSDYEQNKPLTDSKTEQLCIEGLKRVMKAVQSPEEQFDRLGI